MEIKEMKYPSLNLETIEKVFDKLGGLEGAHAFLRGELDLLPGAFQRNEHGHMVFTITGLALVGKQEIERLEFTVYCVSSWARQCFLSTRKDGYDKNHQLVGGQQYKIALVPTREIESDDDRTIDALRKLGVEKYGYQKPLAGIVPRIREAVSNEQMEEMGFWYIVAPHDPIKIFGGESLVFNLDRYDRGSWIHTLVDDADSCGEDSGAVAFLVPA